MSGAGDDRRAARRALTIAAAMGVLLAVALVAVAFLAIGRSDVQPGQPRSPAAGAREAKAPSSDVSWTTVAGVLLPVSRADGPRLPTATTASGFSRRRRGAALAAVHVLIRSSPTAGPQTFESTIMRQVTGVNVAAMKLLTVDEYNRLRADASVAPGQAVEGDARVRGYRVEAFNDAAATVSILLDSPTLQAKGQLLNVQVQLNWASADWRVVAPPRGDWAAATTTLATMPGGAQRYDEGS